MSAVRDYALTGPEAIYSRFRLPLIGFFKRRGERTDDAEDLTQQVFVRLMGRGDRDDVDNPSAFVFQIARNLMADRRRASLQQGAEVALDDQEVIEHLELEGARSPTPERVLVAKDALSDVLRALEELDERTRHIFLLFRVEKLKQAEIAILFGCSKSSVERRILKAGIHLANKHESR